MRKLIQAVLLSLALGGCLDHAAGRAETATKAAGHQLALEQCVDEAMAAIKKDGDRAKAGDVYVVCADAADKKWGRK